MHHQRQRTKHPETNSHETTRSRHRWASLVVVLLLMVASLVGLGPGPADAAETVTVNPTEHYEVMVTPGVGFQDLVAKVPSSNQLANCSYDSTVEDAGIKGGSLYVRLQWRDVEPVEGQYAWPLLDRLFTCAEQRDQTIDFRMMLSYPGAGDRDCFPGQTNTPDHGIPCWLVRKGVSELFYEGYENVAPASYLPDWEDATIRAAHEKLIRALGARYGNHPRLSSVDVGSVGLWGEWHAYPYDAQVMPSESRRIEIIDLYASAFPTTPLVVLAQVFKDELGGRGQVAQHLKANYTGRYGWRGDSWGGSGHHTQDYGPIHAANPNLWKTAPVALEVTGIMDEWAARMGGNDYGTVLPLDRVVGDAMNWHASLAHNKSSRIPSSYVDDPTNEVSRDLRFMATWMGPRLVLQQLSHSDTVEAGAQTQIASAWINRGSAPLYRDYRISYRLRNASGVNVVIQSDTTMKGLLPAGDSPVAKTSAITIPAWVESGDYTLDVAVAHVGDSDLKVPLAITSEVEDNWYELGPMTVSASGPGTGPLSGISAFAPVNGQNAANIVDGNPATGWSNGGAEGNANFTVDLGAVSEVSLIRYQDDYQRELRITLDGTEIFSGWTPAAGEDVFAELSASADTQGQIVKGRQLRFELVSGSWLVPEEVEVYGSVVDVETGSSRLIDMHNGFFGGQNQVWTELNSNFGPIDPAKEKVQTFRFTQSMAAGSTGATFQTRSATSELDVGEMIVYVGPNDQHRVTKVTSVSGSWATFSPPIAFSQSWGQEFWSLYGDAAHPNPVGFRALGDFVLGNFSDQEIDAMGNAKHLFLGDSWMEPGTPTNRRLANRIISRLGGESVQATNRGVGGRTAEDVANALSNDFAAAGGDVDYVWLIVGTNDWIKEVPTESFMANVANIVEYVEGRGATAIVVNSSVGYLDGSRRDQDALLRLSRDYVAAQQAYFDGR